MRRTKAVCLDLDDTLWDLGPAMDRAERSFHGWLSGRAPDLARAWPVERIRELRRTVATEFGADHHDLSAQRREVYRRLSGDGGLPGGLADEAFDVFQRFRNQVDLYADVRPALERLARGRVVVALTNGNADLGAIGLAGYFTATFSAATLGTAKPDPAAFLAVCRTLALEPADVVHAGDDPGKDVVAARRAGMHAVWVNRRGLDWPPDLPPPEHVVGDLEALADLLGP